MTLATKAELKVSIASWLNRDDFTDANLDEFIKVAESRANRLLRCGWMMCRANAAVIIAVNPGDEYIALDPMFAGMTEVTFTSDAGDITNLTYQTPMQAGDRAREDETGTPLYYGIYENQIRLLPRPDTAGTLEIWQFERFGLVDDTDTNWLLTYHPDLYLYGSCTAAMPFLKDDNRVAVWDSKFLEGIRDLRISDAFDRNGGTRHEPAEYF